MGKNREKILAALERALKIDYRRVVYSEPGEIPPGISGIRHTSYVPGVAMALSGELRNRIFFNGIFQELSFPPGDVLFLQPNTWNVAPTTMVNSECFGFRLNPHFLRLINYTMTPQTPLDKNEPEYFFHMSESRPTIPECVKLLELLGRCKDPENIAPEIIKTTLRLLHTDLCNYDESTERGAHMTYQQIVAFLEEHFQSDLMREDVAQRFELSPTYVSKLFHRFGGGMTFNRLLNNLRLSAAASLLQKSSMNCEEIAEACGYQDAKYFNRRFHERYKQPPSAWRSTVKGNTIS
jgi:AraC-like DNA-binding protein